MGTLNKATIIGNLCRDPELKSTKGGMAVCNITVATSYKGKGEEEKTEYHRVTAWGDTATNCAKYLAKGRSVYVEGRLQTREHEKDGIKRYSTEIVAERVVFLGGNREGAAPAGDTSTVGDESVPF